jgi:hypothetical protein
VNSFTQTNRKREEAPSQAKTSRKALSKQVFQRQKEGRGGAKLMRVNEYESPEYGGYLLGDNTF